MGNKPLPTQSQFLLSTSLLLLLSLCLAPVSACACLLAYGYQQWHKNGKASTDRSRKTVLVNGAKMFKSLGIVRALGKAGCRVIVAESGLDGSFSATRLSRYVSKYYQLPTAVPGDEQSCQNYVNALADIAAKEKVGIFIPCSGAGTTVEDAKAAKVMHDQSHGHINAFIPSADLTKVLHEKDLFMDLCKDMNLPTPESHVVDSPTTALKLIKESKYPMILKATAVLDDLGRNDMTNYPLSGDVGPDYPKTLARLEKGLSVPMTKKTPYILQQFVEGSEWCTHATVSKGKLVAFVCCPSNDMLMRYEDHTETEVGKKALEWTEQFLSTWAKSERGEREVLQGHFSMDFIQSDSGDLYPIECNPRIHTAICLLRSNTQFAEAYLSTPKTVAKPLSKTKPCSWIGHDLPACYLASLLPMTDKVHPYWEPLRVNEVKWDTQDPTWDLQDPLPFFGLYHVQWTWILAKQMFWKGKKWVRINASTARVFECP